MSDISNWISGFALFVAILAYLNTRKHMSIDSQRTFRIALTDVVAALVQVDWERHILDSDNIGVVDDQLTEKRRLLNAKRRYLAAHGEFLANQIPDLISENDFLNLARGFGEAGDLDKARVYWDKCIALSSAPATRVFNLRGGANFLFAWVSLTRVEKHFESRWKCRCRTAMRLEE